MGRFVLSFFNADDFSFLDSSGYLIWSFVFLWWICLVILVWCYLSSHLYIWGLLLSNCPLVGIEFLNRHIGLFHADPSLNLFSLCQSYKGGFFLVTILRLLLYFGSSNSLIVCLRYRIMLNCVILRLLLLMLAIFVILKIFCQRTLILVPTLIKHRSLRRAIFYRMFDSPASPTIIMNRWALIIYYLRWRYIISIPRFFNIGIRFQWISHSTSILISVILSSSIS
jgi:hypothetical protein